MKIVYNYPEDAANGDDFVVDDVLISPTTVEIQLRRYVPKTDDRQVRDREALYIADRIVQKLRAERGTGDPTLYLLIQAYRTARPLKVHSTEPPLAVDPLEALGYRAVLTDAGATHYIKGGGE